jgi:hypothetical protein
MAEDPMTAVLDLLAAHAERLTQLEAQAATWTATTGKITELAVLVRQLEQRLTTLDQRTQPATTTAGQPDRRGLDQWPYDPAPVRRWWKLAGPDRAVAVASIRAWVEQVYQPGYGQLAAALAPCWDQHPLCLYALDILAELWSVLYLDPYRPPSLLTAQAEYQARILPALAEQMATETSRCRHRRDQYHSATGPVRRTP